MNHSRIITDSFHHGLSSGLLIFDRVQRPGSCSAELAAATTPEMLAAYQGTSIPALLLDLQEQERKRDANYASLVQVLSCMWWLAVLGAFVYLGMNGHPKEAFVVLVPAYLVLILNIIRARM